MAGLIGLRAEDMEQVDALQKLRLEFPHGLPMVRPSVRALVLVAQGDGWVAKPARFGFSRRFPSINARTEKLQESPAWRRMFGRSHGIVPLSYVIEWMEEEGEKRPYLMQRADRRLWMAPALVGPHFEEKDELAFAICTREPNRFFGAFHDRMVGLCPDELVDRWLRPDGREPARLLECIAAPRDDALMAVPSSPLIQKRQKGDWSALPEAGPPVTWADVETRSAPVGGALPRDPPKPS